MVVRQDLRDALRLVGNLLKHRELIRRNRNVFVHAGLNMPAREISAIRARKCARAETADRRALPVAIVNVGLVLANPGVFERLPERSSPCDLRNLISVHLLRAKRCKH